MALVARNITHTAEDDIDMDAAERTAERRLREAGLAVPARLLSREEAWGLPHATEQSAAIDGEMVDEEADWRRAEPPHNSRGQRTCGASGSPRGRSRLNIYTCAQVRYRTFQNSNSRV